MISEQARSAGWIVRILFLHVPPAGMSVCPVAPVGTPNIDGNKPDFEFSFEFIFRGTFKQVHRTEEFVSSPNSARYLEVLVGAAGGLCKKPGSSTACSPWQQQGMNDGPGTVTNIAYLLE